jgi:Flp pilus assembly protein TadD
VNRKQRRAAQGTGTPDTHALLMQGVQAHEAGRLQEAEAIYKRVLAKAPKNPDALHLAGVVAHQTGRHDRAVDLIGKARKLNEAAPLYHGNMGLALMALRRPAEAARHFARAAALVPNDVAALANLGRALLMTEEMEGAVEALAKAVALAPNEAELHFMLAGALEDAGRPAEAEPAFRKALELNGGVPQIHNDFANFLRAQGRDAEAIVSFDAALKLNPAFDTAQVNRGLALLALGNFAQGWRDCLPRRSIATYRDRLTQQPLPADLTGKRVMLHRDQGLGDEILFLRFAPALKQRGAWIAYRSQSKIAAMIARLDFLDQVIDEGAAMHDAPVPPDIDMEISASDLPLMLGMESTSDIPPSITLPPLPDLEQEMRARLEAAGPPPYVGVTWRAGQQKRNRLSKVAPLDGIAAALRGKGATLIALQRGPEAGEIDRLAALSGCTVHDATLLNDDLERMLALVGLLDDYICVSNTNTHLRAARGGTSHVLVPLPADYRWMAEGAESPWFPGSPVYREDAAAGWEPVLAALAADLSRG